MDQFFVLLTAIIFFFIGRISKSNDTEIIEKAGEFVESAKRVVEPVVTYMTPEEREYDGSEQEQIDKQIEQNIIEAEEAELKKQLEKRTIT